MARPRHRSVALLTGAQRNPRRFRTNQPTKQKLARPKGEKSRPFNAKYVGECPACFARWEPGARIQRVGQFYYHADCVK